MKARHQVRWILSPLTSSLRSRCERSGLSVLKLFTPKLSSSNKNKSIKKKLLDFRCFIVEVIFKRNIKHMDLIKQIITSPSTKKYFSNFLINTLNEPSNYQIQQKYRPTKMGFYSNVFLHTSRPVIKCHSLNIIRI